MIDAANRRYGQIAWQTRSRCLLTRGARWWSNHQAHGTVIQMIRAPAARAFTLGGAPTNDVLTQKKERAGARSGFDAVYGLLSSALIASWCFGAELQGFFLAGDACDCLRAIRPLLVRHGILF